MRKCKFKVYITPEGQTAREWVEKIGFFHMWGADAEEDRDGNIAPYTVAIVEEIETGQVYNAAPAHITFLN